MFASVGGFIFTPLRYEKLCSKSIISRDIEHPFLISVHISNILNIYIFNVWFKKNFNFAIVQKPLEMKRIIIQIVLLIVIIILAYLVYDSVNKPLEFNAMKDKREKAVIKDLKDIRSGQQIYKKMFDEYASDFDTLLTFLREGEIPIVKKIPDPDDTTFTKTINDTIGYISVADSLYGKRAHFNLDSLPYIPMTGLMYDLQAGEIERGGLNVHVFEAKAHYKDILKGLDFQMIINLVKARDDIEKYPGLKVGSMIEPSTDGNWA
jgi:ABC-type cobalt transport system substrate-binding protein